MEKALSASKYESHVLKKELQLCVEEKEVNQKAMEALQKQHLEDARKMARLEADRNRLRAIVKKKLSSAGSVSQMLKAEAEDILYCNGSSGSAPGRKNGSSVSNSTRPWRISYPSSHGVSEAHRLQGETLAESGLSSCSTCAKKNDHNSKVEAMAERMMAMEEETRKLQETLAARDAELHCTRQEISINGGSRKFEESTCIEYKY